MQASNFMPYLIGFAAMSCYAALPAISKKILQDLPPITLIFTCVVFLSLYSGIWMLFYDKGASLSAMKGPTWGGVVILAAVNMGGYFLYMTTIKMIPVTQYQMIYIFSPIIAAFFALLLLGEPFKMRYLAGLAVMGLGLFIALYDSVKT